MGVSNLAVVFLCVLGAGAVVVVGAGFSRFFLPNLLGSKNTAADDPEGLYWNQRSPEQDSYLKKVRDTNLMQIYAQAKHDRAEVHQAQSYVSTSAYGNGGGGGAGGGGAYSNYSHNGTYTQGRYSSERPTTQGTWSET